MRSPRNSSPVTVQRFDASDPAAYPELAREILSDTQYPGILAVWEMTVYDNLTSEEIGAKLDMNPNTVRKYRAKAGLMMRDAVRSRAEVDAKVEEACQEGALRFAVTIVRGGVVDDMVDTTQRDALSRVGHRRFAPSHPPRHTPHLREFLLAS